MVSSLLIILLAAGLAASQNTNLQAKFPVATATSNLPAVRTIAPGQKFDGRMMQWDRSPSTCKGQNEGGDKDAVFILEDGATLSNVIIGPNNGEGVHCKGSCTLNNVWWTKVCEDAATFLQKSGTSYVNGGGARGAKDKVLQHNGGGTVAVKNFLASDIGKLYRSCGNCKMQYQRHSTFTNVKIQDKASVLAGVNENYGDTTSIKDSCVLKGDVCARFEGNSSGKEPTKIGTGASGKVCAIQGVKTSGC